MNDTTAAALLPTRITVDDVSDKYGISAAPPRGLSRPILFRPEDVERWVSGEPPVERDEDAWRC